MSNGAFIVGALMAAFVLFLAANNRLAEYVGLLLFSKQTTTGGRGPLFPSGPPQVTPWGTPSNPYPPPGWGDYPPQQPAPGSSGAGLG